MVYYNNEACTDLSKSSTLGVTHSNNQIFNTKRERKDISSNDELRPKSQNILFNDYIK